MFPQTTPIPYDVERAYELTICTATVASGGFSGAHVFRAMTSDGRELAIRATPKAIALSSERLVGLYRLLLQISQTGCRVIPVPFFPATDAVPALRGCLQPRIPWIELDGTIWQVEPWMHGSPLTGNAVTAEHLSSALTALNQFHKLATSAVNIVGSDAWLHNTTKPLPSIQRRLQIVTELTHGKLDTLQRHLATDSDERFRGLAVRVCKSLRTWLPWLHSQLTEIASIAFPVQPVLRDVWRAHVLFTDNQVTGLIDLSAAASDHVAVDVTRLIRSWFGSDISGVRNAVAEFQGLRVLDTSEQRLMELLDASTVLLSPVTWLQRRMESGSTENCPDNVIVRLLELAEVAETFCPLVTSDR